jgi:hypothetical protein
MEVCEPPARVKNDGMGGSESRFVKHNDTNGDDPCGGWTTSGTIAEPERVALASQWERTGDGASYY